MKTALVQIGNSRGILIPRSFLRQCQPPDVVELENHGGYLTIRPASWPEAVGMTPFATCAKTGTITFQMMRVS